MKTLVCTGPGVFEYRPGRKPVLMKGMALIAIRRIGICGTDLHAFEGTQPFFSYPRILGHELAGELVDIDGAGNFIPGEAISFIPYFSCGACIACRNGKTNCCVQMQVCGVHVDGGMAEYLSVPASALLHGSGLSLDELALLEPLAVGAHGVWRASIQPGEYVLVIGAGPIGLATIEFGRLEGGKLIAMDVNDVRLQFCKNKFSDVHIVNAADHDAFEQVRAMTNGDMPAVVIDATGSRDAINNAFRYMAHGGRYVLIGLQPGDIVFSHPEFHKREGTLMSSRNATRKDFDLVVASLQKREVNPVSYITHRAKFEDVKDRFEGWLDPGQGVIKAMVEMT